MRLVCRRHSNLPQVIFSVRGHTLLYQSVTYGCMTPKSRPVKQCTTILIFQVDSGTIYNEEVTDIIEWSHDTTGSIYLKIG